MAGIVSVAAYNLGSYVGEANQNACYSEALELIQTYAKKSDSEQVNDLFKTLPLSGYETHCRTVVEAIEKYTAE